jgi:hypothetical protein
MNRIDLDIWNDQDGLIPVIDNSYLAGFGSTATVVLHYRNNFKFGVIDVMFTGAVSLN